MKLKAYFNRSAPYFSKVGLEERQNALAVELPSRKAGLWELRTHLLTDVSGLSGGISYPLACRQIGEARIPYARSELCLK
ncbi:MAG TPA: hypothetical protein VGL34_23960 [Steroidobacteraceae bacterium]|jgi:hypothetical protein